ncbi:prephenate/arogenate dehydrogenase [Prochlorococcus sp. MIT 1223]|uniref:prephenate/arogenate dehydrogenase n=1 Tax=Prochlorococcus sp. MIT 1223 TaxID=3096217 RepID=UPI002A755B01|nr:prephenate/arogenate dehydrogenase [Prochlorococcus sp. MIT 1223]
MTQTLKPSKTIGIVGLGLIGGSLGLALQKVGYNVHGLTHRSITAARAKKRGLANLISTNHEILQNCSTVILALPLNQLLNPNQNLIDALPINATITDVGSVKEPIVKIWKNLHPKFVGSHPMAGTSQSGVEAGEVNLFNGKAWVTTPDSSTDIEALQTVRELAVDLGCHWISANPADHDQAVALISHLPVLVSAALLKTADNEKSESISNLARALASSGFADTTRIGGGNAELGLSMMANNTEAIIYFLNSYQETLKEFKDTISSKDWNSLRNKLEKTHEIRPDFLNN